jgi:hypothetical protein
LCGGPAAWPGLHRRPEAFLGASERFKPLQMLDESRLERVEAIFDSVGVLPGFGVRTQPPVTFTPGGVFGLSKWVKSLTILA